MYYRKLYSWFELSNEMKKVIIERYGIDFVDDYCCCADALFDADGFVNPF